VLRERNRLFYVLNKHTIHAEKKCLLNIKYKVNLRICKMLTVKIVNGIPIIWNSCKMCSNLLRKYNVKIEYLKL